MLSLGLHAVLLAWLLHRPAPIFVAPSSTLAGAYGTTVTHLYWPSASDAAASVFPASTRSPLVWKQLRKTQPTPQPSEPEAVQEASNRPPAGASAGSPYGSLSDGADAGHEIRPALPVVMREPFVDRRELTPGTDGNVVIEITIDEAGNVVSKVVIASLGAEVDGKVLAALDNWRFRPATRDGIPIPSKQDVVYHFKAL